KRIVSSDVKEFVRSFEKGARDPELYFKDPKADAQFVMRWKTTPKADRVFVIGSGEDAEAVMSVKTQLEKQGKVVLFYKFCAENAGALCQSTTVGAFLGTAGVAILTDTGGATGSRFVPQEVRASAQILAGQTRLFLIAPSDLTTPTANGTV